MPCPRETAAAAPVPDAANAPDAKARTVCSNPNNHQNGLIGSPDRRRRRRGNPGGKAWAVTTILARRCTIGRI